VLGLEPRVSIFCLFLMCGHKRFWSFKGGFDYLCLYGGVFSFNRGMPQVLALIKCSI
jgi:hypothetical protein